MVDHMFCLKKAWKSGFAEFGHVWLFKKFRRHHSHASGGSIDLQSDGRALSTPKYPTVNERDRACLSQSEARDSCKPEIYHESTLSIYLSDGKFGDNGGDPRSSVLPRNENAVGEKGKSRQIPEQQHIGTTGHHNW